MVVSRRAGPSANAHNTQLVQTCRTFATVVGGATAGILGVRGIYGILFYLVLVAATAAVVLFKASGAAAAYWHHPAAVLGGAAAYERPLLLSYLLFWSLFYSAVHLY